MQQDKSSSKNKKTGITVVMVVVGMFAMAYASFPLYQLFCKVTGYGGTPKIADGEVMMPPGERVMEVRFNADVAKNFPWDFKPVQGSVKVRTGEQRLIFYTAENKSDRQIKGVATFNITPDQAAVYFNKIQCFCFNEQTLQPGQKVNMPVSFFVDPAIEDDKELKNVKTVTLSYTFFEAE